MEDNNVTRTEHFETADLESAVELLRVVSWASNDVSTVHAATTGIEVLRRALAEPRTRELFRFLSPVPATPSRST